MVETLQAEICRSYRFSKWGGSLWAQFRPPTTVSVRKLEWLHFCVISKYLQCVVWFCHKVYMWWTDMRTDRIVTANCKLA